MPPSAMHSCLLPHSRGYANLRWPYMVPGHLPCFGACTWLQQRNEAGTSKGDSSKRVSLVRGKQANQKVLGQRLRGRTAGPRSCCCLQAQPCAAKSTGRLPPIRWVRMQACGLLVLKWCLLPWPRPCVSSCGHCLWSFWVARAALREATAAVDVEGHFPLLLPPLLVPASLRW